jgi:hypothetical protein
VERAKQRAIGARMMTDSRTVYGWVILCIG